MNYRLFSGAGGRGGGGQLLQIGRYNGYFKPAYANGINGLLWSLGYALGFAVEISITRQETLSVKKKINLLLLRLSDKINGRLSYIAFRDD